MQTLLSIDIFESQVSTSKYKKSCNFKKQNLKSNNKKLLKLDSKMR